MNIADNPVIKWLSGGYDHDPPLVLPDATFVGPKQEGETDSDEVLRNALAEAEGRIPL